MHNWWTSQATKHLSPSSSQFVESRPAAPLTQPTPNLKPSVQPYTPYNAMRHEALTPEPHIYQTITYHNPFLPISKHSSDYSASTIEASTSKKHNHIPLTAP